MKFKVQYYDYDSDKTIENDCFEFNYDTKDNQFSFIPVDNPVKIYKTVVIDRPVVNIGYNSYNKDKLQIYVDGYQCVKSGGYWKTTTLIYENENDNE